uniref:Uncharacterized protein n=1 Tax=Knipowitschia caucasica TaxID=637954 RepID=A0AAV2KKL9_KNICA
MCQRLNTGEREGPVNLQERPVSGTIDCTMDPRDTQGVAVVICAWDGGGWKPTRNDFSQSLRTPRDFTTKASTAAASKRGVGHSRYRQQQKP